MFFIHYDILNINVTTFISLYICNYRERFRLIRPFVRSCSPKGAWHVQIFPQQLLCTPTPHFLLGRITTSLLLCKPLQDPLPPIPSVHLLLFVSSLRPYCAPHYFLHTVTFSSFGKMFPDLFLFPPQPEGTSLDSVPNSVALRVPFSSNFPMM